MTKEISIKNKTITGIAYSFGGYIINSGVEFVFGIVLARLLLPQDYGILGMVIVFIVISQVFIDGGMTTALIREKEVSHEDYSTVFYYNFVLAIVMYGIIFVSANAISDFFGEPTLVVIVRVMGLNLILGSIGLIQNTMLARKLDFKTQTKIGMIASITGGILAIGFAYYGFGVWSLVIKTLATQMIASTLLIAHNKWVPLLKFSKASFKKLFGFGWKILLTALLAALYNNVYNIIIGRVYSSTLLGYYTKSTQLSAIVANSITASVSKVSYPVLSQLQDDPVRFRAGFRKIIKTTSYINVPMMIGLAVTASPVIQLLFGDNWVPMTPYFQIICLCGITLPHVSMNLNILQVVGRSDLFLKLDIVMILIGLSAIGIVVVLDLGIYGLLWTLFIIAIIAFFVDSHYSKKYISYSTKEQLIDMIPSVSASVIMGIAVYTIGYLLPFGNLLILPIQILVGVAIYVVISKLAKIEEFDTIYGLIKTAIQRQRSSTNSSEGE